MANKTVKRVITHPNFYMAVEGKLQKQKVGTELTLSIDEAKRLKSKLADPAETKQLKDGKLTAGGDDKSQAEVNSLQSKVDELERGAKLASDEIDGSRVQLQKLAEALAKSQTENATLKKAAKK